MNVILPMHYEFITCRLFEAPQTHLTFTESVNCCPIEQISHLITWTWIDYIPTGMSFGVRFNFLPAHRTFVNILNFIWIVFRLELLQIVLILCISIRILFAMIVMFFQLVKCWKGNFETTQRAHMNTSIILILAEIPKFQLSWTFFPAINHKSNSIKSNRKT